MDQKELQKRLNQPYTSENWKEIVRYVFPNVLIFASSKIIPVKDKDKDYVDSLYQLGTVQLKDGKILDLLELKLKENVNLLKNRVKLNDIVSSTVDMDRSHGVLSVFEKGTEDYRFTFSAKASAFDEEEGDFVVQRTDTRRFTYLLGKNESCKTPAERFQTLSTKKNDADISTIEDAFSVEKLSKKFFEDYKKQYEAFVAYLTNTPGYYTAVFSNDDKKIRDFVKIFLGRIVFIKFVQKKGWMGVPANERGWENGEYRFLEDAFKNFNHKDNFYSEFLNPLFFEALDKGDRPNNIFTLTGTKVPYLSGGLFDNHDPKTRTINFPKAYFESLFDFLDRYNFTIDENDVNDQEVGIDPEMLGHIFENLLEDNKDKGAFYTPKEIVRYMCRESLKEYLKTSLQEQNIWPKNEDKAKTLEAGLDDFVNKREAGGIIDFEGSIAQALKTVKICDPAIGSGAFPMGLLQEIFHLMHLLYDASPDKVGEIWELDTWRPNVVKQNIIQNSIYGVDIEKGAIDIARLRFWLSLIVDEPEPTALPHLDYKIVVGNSLISKFEDTIIKIDWEAEDPNAGFFGSQLAEDRADILKKISNKQKQAFEPESDDEKLSIEIRDLKIDLLIKQLEVMIEKQNIPEEPKINDYQNKTKSKFIEDQKRYFETLEWKQQIQKLKKLKLKSEATLHFFDWKLDFPEVLNDKISKSVGFDIVIGNPPYIQLQKMGEETDLLQGSNFKTFSRTGDIYCLFYEQGINLLKSGNGVLSFITSNTWMRTKFGGRIRKFFTEEINTKQLLNFEDTQIFPSATVEVNILIAKKEMPDNGIWAAVIKGDYKAGTSIPNYFNKNKILLNDLGEESWAILPKDDYEIKKHISEKGTLIKNWNIDFYRGFLTGCNDAFFIDGHKKNELIKADPKCAPYIKPLLRGREIKKYNYEFNEKYVIFTRRGFSLDEHPSIKEHLLSFRPQLEPKPKGYNEKISGEWQGRKPGTYLWYDFQDNIAYHPIFEKEKLIWLSISDKPAFALDRNKMYVTAPAYILKSDCNKYLMTVLNSKIMEWYLDKVSSSTGVGTNQWSKIFVEQLPIPELNIEKRKPFEIMAEYLIFLNNPNQEVVISGIENSYIFSYFDYLLNLMVFEIYFEEEMKSKDIDVLQYFFFQDISELVNKDKQKYIKEAFQELEDLNNPLGRKIVSASKNSEILKRIIGVIESENMVSTT